MNGDLIGDYRQLEKLNAQGDVWSVEHVVTGERFVLGFTHGRPSEEMLRAFAVAREVEHESLVLPRDFFEHEGTTVVVREPPEGASLDGLFRDKPPLPLALHYALPIFRALDALHARGFVHETVEPKRIRIVRGERARLEWDPLWRLDRFRPFGTPDYVCPERLVGKGRVTGAADVWSMGVVLYELATGRRPFRGAVIVELFVDIGRAEPAPLERWRRDCPPELSRLVLACLRRDPDARPSALEAANAIETIAQS